MASVQLKDFSMYYISEGSGEPLVLLHGNGESHKIFLPTIKKLSKHFKVYALDSRNHGKSKCKVIQYNYVQMANDVFEFIKAKGIKSTHIYGFSDGGIIGLILAIKHPEIIKTLMMSGINLNPKGIKLKTRIAMKLTELFSSSEDERKRNKLMLKHPHINPELLKDIKCKTMLTIGQRDVIKRKHTLLIKEKLPKCELIIVKKGNHDNYVIDNPMIGDLILEFMGKKTKEKSA